MLRAMGKTILLSGAGHYHLLPAFLRRYTQCRIIFLLGLPNLSEVFAAQHYRNLPGGLLEGMGRLFMGDVRLAVCPAWQGRRHLCLDDFAPPKNCALLYRQLKESGRLVAVPYANQADKAPLPDEELTMIQRGDKAWRRVRPAPLPRPIRKHRG